MSEKEYNRRYIEKRLSKVTEAWRINRALVEEVRKMLSEAYIDGIEQGHFDREMDYEPLLKKVRKEKWQNGK